MPISVLVHGTERPSAESAPASRAFTLDAPRLVIGRGEGCEIRLPDASVSHRHASLRQRGNEWLLVDEGSTNGTRIGRTRLAVQAPRTLGPRELVRLGRVWVELRTTAEPATPGATAVAREVALDLVIANLARSGEDVRPRVRVVEGADRGREAVVASDGPLVVGRSREAGLCLDEPDASRRHLEIQRRGDALVVRDLGSKAGSTLGERALGSGEAVWRPGVPLRVGDTLLEYEFEAAAALAELERMPDERVPAAELEIGADEPALPALDAATDEELDPVEDEVQEASPEPSPDAPQVALEERPEPRRSAGWSVTDLAVLVLALGVFSLSAVGYVVLLR